MKKLLGISLVAVLAVSPLVASAADPVAPSSSFTDNTSGLLATDTAKGVVVATNGAYYAGKSITDNDRQRAATAAYVKGAYNDAISAVNKVSADTVSALADKQDTISDLSAIRSGAEAGATALQESSISTGTDNGKITVGTKQVAVKGLGSAAYTESSAYATSAQGAKADSALQESSIDTGTANGKIKVGTKEVSVYGLGSAAYTPSTNYATSSQGAKADTAVQTVKVNGVALEEDANGAANIVLTDYAKKTGVTQTITNSTITGTVPAVTDWTNETSGSVTISAGITGAAYAEPQS